VALDILYQADAPEIQCSKKSSLISQMAIEKPRGAFILLEVFHARIPILLNPVHRDAIALANPRNVAVYWMH
jgi:hypothetical protein